MACLALASSANAFTRPALATSRPHAPASLSAATNRVPISSTYGSGSFGLWGEDGFGLPDYRYTLDEARAPQAAQPELAGNRAAWHQIGNDRVVADAFNHGYVQLWSQDRVYQWMNYYQASSDHFSGGYGYVDLGGRSWSTLYLDRRPGESVKRIFGTGYAETDVKIPGLAIKGIVSAPFGNDPLLLHDVTLTNTSGRTESPTWYEYWDVDPAIPSAGAASFRATSLPAYDAATKTLSVAQLPTAQDTNPLSIFASALNSPVAGFDTNTHAFFGSGTRVRPAAVAADTSHDSIALPSLGGSQGGDQMFAFRSPVTLRPGQSVTLRYAYGYSHPAAIKPLVARYRSDASAFATSEARWRAYVPQVNLGRRYRWLSRELQWDAYMLRSDATYEECAGEHLLSQAGYYQYGLGIQAAYRDPLQLMLPMIYEDPELAREVILYSAEEQSQGIDEIPYGRISNCQRFDLGTSDDLDLWLLMAAEEYGLATRDTGFFNTPVRWASGGSGSLWSHLQLAFTHQQSLRSLHGDYLTGSTGDWSDLSTEELQMTESSLVTAQAAYVYPRMSELAALGHQQAFASDLGSAGTTARRTVAGEWVGRGWYARGWSGTTQLGVGTIFEEPQPWAILAGIPTKARARTLVANIRRFLTGIGAPGGPSKIGSAESPGADDPLATEHSTPAPTSGSAVFVGGVWYSLNGWLTWALGTLDGRVPHARADAFGELVRNTLAAHATAFPRSWDGVLSVDDVCGAWYAKDPSQCGVGLTTSYDTQIPHQDAWTLWDTAELAGISSTEAGFRIVPHLPMTRFGVRFQGAGVASAPHVLRGYIRPQASGKLAMQVARPPASQHRQLIAYVGRRRVRSHLSGGLVRFELPTVAGRAADWAVIAFKPVRRKHRRARGCHAKRDCKKRPRPTGGRG
jgi:hypothetical protein